MTHIEIFTKEANVDPLFIKLIPIIISLFAFLLALKGSKDQRRMTRNKFLIDLYHEIKLIKSVPIVGARSSEVVKIANILDLVGIAVKEKMVDSRVIQITFRDTFISLYEQIEKATLISGTKRSGKDILKRTPYAQYLYIKFKAPHTIFDRIIRYISFIALSDWHTI